MVRTLPHIRAHEIPDSSVQRTSWLVEGLWGEAAVGIIGGEPKSYKSFLALDCVVSIASGRLCLGRFKVKQGRVLLFAAEDKLELVKARLTGIAAARGIPLCECDIHVINADRLRLDVKEDMLALDATVAALKPTLLLLDPFVRLHRIDENSSAEVSSILDNLRVLQRQHNVAVMVVHHAKKNGGNMRAGQALRGSSEFHAWLDSMIYMRKTVKDQITLSVEHRAAAPISPLTLELKCDNDNQIALAICEAKHESDDNIDTSPAERIVELLKERAEPVSTNEMRAAACVREQLFWRELKALLAGGRIAKLGGGLYALAE